MSFGRSQTIKHWTLVRCIKTKCTGSSVKAKKTKAQMRRPFFWGNKTQCNTPWSVGKSQALREETKRGSVLATVNKKYTTELPEGKETGSVLAENWVVSAK